RVCELWPFGSPGDPPSRRRRRPALGQSPGQADRVVHHARRHAGFSLVRFPGLTEMLDRFYRAIVQGGEAPVSPEHLIRVTALFETLAERVRDAASAVSASAAPASPRPETGPLVVV